MKNPKDLDEINNRIYSIKKQLMQEIKNKEVEKEIILDISGQLDLLIVCEGMKLK